MTFGSLFAGIGGFDLGLGRAGMECRWQVEIDPHCQQVLAKHWPGVKRYGDIRTVTGIEPVDVVCGGFPCQDISNAGSRAGIDGERSGLWSEYVRLIRELRPRYVIVENVAALLGRGMGRVLGDLSACGCDAEWQIIRASDMGAPHQRERIWILAYSDSQGGPRLVKGGSTIAAGPWRWNGKKDLRVIADAPFVAGDHWPQPLLRRVDDGVSLRLDRLHILGNAVVPQIAEWFGRRIVEFENEGS